jgi:hypothetical protein
VLPVNKYEVHWDARNDEHKSNAYLQGADIKRKRNQEQADNKKDNGEDNVYLYGRDQT